MLTRLDNILALFLIPSWVKFWVPSPSFKTLPAQMRLMNSGLQFDRFAISSLNMGMFHLSSSTFNAPDHVPATFSLDIAEFSIREMSRKCIEDQEDYKTAPSIYRSFFSHPLILLSAVERDWKGLLLCLDYLVPKNTLLFFFLFLALLIFLSTMFIFIIFHDLSFILIYFYILLMRPSSIGKPHLETKDISILSYYRYVYNILLILYKLHIIKITIITYQFYFLDILILLFSSIHLANQTCHTFIQLLF